MLTGRHAKDFPGLLGLRALLEAGVSLQLFACRNAETDFVLPESSRLGASVHS